MVEFFLERESAEAMIGEVREDEPALAVDLRVEAVETRTELVSSRSANGADSHQDVGPLHGVGSSAVVPLNGRRSPPTVRRHQRSERMQREVPERASYDGLRCADADTDVSLFDSGGVTDGVNLLAIDAERQRHRLAADAAHVDVVVVAVDRLTCLDAPG